jgi:hypothetical protein
LSPAPFLHAAQLNPSDLCIQKKTNPVSNNTTDLQTGAYKDSLKREKNILDDEEHQELTINFNLKPK